MQPSSLIAVLDANVLYPFTLRDTLLRAAAAGLFQARWSDKILEEALHRCAIEHEAVVLDTIINGIELESDATPRTWWQKRLLALGTCVGLSIGVALLALLAAGVGSAWTFVSHSTSLGAVDLESTLVRRAARLGVGAGVWVALVSGLYLVALPASSRIPIVPGAVLATVLQIGLGLAYGFYLSKPDTGAPTRPDWRRSESR
jgi:hypothetical protein